MKLSELKNSFRPNDRRKRVGRGVGSKRGKTSCRGHKGDGSRSGYKRRYQYDGGGVPLHRRLPCRGFSRGRFVKPVLELPFSLINKLYQDGDVVNPATLQEKGFSMQAFPGGIKILFTGLLKKKVTIEAHKFSSGALKKLEEDKISFKKLEK